jgi:hypothetical protein
MSGEYSGIRKSWIPAAVIRVVQDAVQTGWRHHPAVGTAIRVEPCPYLVDPLPQAMRRHADPDRHREAALGLSEHLPGGPHRAAQ